jgi:hypothetical protein
VLVWIKLLHNILSDFGISMKLVVLITMCLNENYSKVPIGKYLSDAFLIRLSDRSRCIINIALQLCDRIYHLEGSRK